MTPNQPPLSYAVKMALKSGTVILCICFVTFGPIFAFSQDNEAVPLYDYIMQGHERVPSVRTKREVLTEEDINLVLDIGDLLVRRLANYEEILKGRELSPGQGSPSYPAMLVSWADDTTIPLAKQAFINVKASLRASHQFCNKNKPLEWCSAEMRKQTKLDESREECVSPEFRSYNGSCNNVHHPRWGLALTTYARLLPPSYEDGIWEPRSKETYAENHVNAADVSHTVVSYSNNPQKGVTLATVAWANLLSYDMAHTVSMRMVNNGASVHCCDEENGRLLAPRHRHPFCFAVVDHKDTKCYNYVRSLIVPPDEYRFGPAQQMNAVSHYLDGSVVYGSTPEEAVSLRTMSGGLLKDIGGQTIPSDPSDITGEMRVNIDILSAVVHSILMKEHNRVAKELVNINAGWDDERLYQEARRIVVAELQHITYAEWLPLLIGEKETSRTALKITKTGFSNVYDGKVKPNVFNSFANAAMRFVVSMVDEKLSLYDEEREVSQNVSLTFSFIDASLLENNLDSLVRGITTQHCQASDLSLSPNVHRHLYSTEGSPEGFDALSMDIQRGRDHGLPPYVSFRKLMGYRFSTFDDLVSTIPKSVVSYLKKVYPKVNTIDLVVGGLAETPKKGSLLGPVFSGIIAQQMAATRTGDLYFYDNKEQPYPFTLDQLNEIKKTSLARIFCDNSSVKKMQPRAFLEPNSSGNNLVNCKDEIIPRLNLQLWREEFV